MGPSSSNNYQLAINRFSISLRGSKSVGGELLVNSNCVLFLEARLGGD